MDIIKYVAEALIILVLASIFLYAGTRIVSSAYFKSKAEFVERMRRGRFIGNNLLRKGAHNINEVMPG